jgi:AraC-like DNA-binding protein
MRQGIVTTIRRQCATTLFEPAVVLNDKIVILILDTNSANGPELRAAIRDSLESAVESIRGAFQVSIFTTVLACEDGIGPLIELNPALLVQQALSERRERRRPEQTADEIPFLKRVIEHVEKNYASDISLSDAAALAYLSPVYFGRIFKDHVGVPFTEYLAAVRVRKAIELLQEPEHKVLEVAQMVGYSSSRYFARVFKKSTGYSPREYRTQVLARGFSS